MDEATITKATLRIPTREQFSYIEVEVTGTPDQIIAMYLSFTQKYRDAVAS